MNSKSSEKIIYLGIGILSLFGILLTAFLIFKASRLSGNSVPVVDFSSERVSTTSADSLQEASLSALLTLDFGTASKEAERLSTYSGIIDNKTTALDFLAQIAKENNFTLEWIDQPFGAFVKAISGIVNKRSLLWIFYYNGRSAPISPDKQVLRAGDSVEFRYSPAN
ncbi:MAG: DUF4430 domain-containing protein [Patescibacteria group bacterium]